MPGFTGFPEEGLEFLQELAANNNREWFEANKKVYQNQLQKPAIAFVEQVGQQLMELSEGIRYDLRTNGSGTLMRIHRDTRFSLDKTPYKTNISGMFWEGSGKKTESPAFGFQLETDGMHLMTGMFQFSKPWLKAYRDAVIDETRGESLEEVISSLRENYHIAGEHYKQVPRGYEKEHPRADYLRYNSLYAYPSKVSVEHLTRSELVDVCMEHFVQMFPLHRWLVQLSACS